MAQQHTRREAEDRALAARKSMWLTHHWPGEYDRCAIVREHHVCRRCPVFYPISLAVACASLAGLPPWPARLDVWFIWLLCIPATLDFLAEKLLGVAYSSQHQVVVTTLVAVAIGSGLAEEIDDRWSWLFWGPVLVFGGIWFAAALFRAQRTTFEQALAGSREYGDFADLPEG